MCPMERYIKGSKNTTDHQKRNRIKEVSVSAERVVGFSATDWTAASYPAFSTDCSICSMPVLAVSYVTTMLLVSNWTCTSMTPSCLPTLRSMAPAQAAQVMPETSNFLVSIVNS